MKNKILKIVTVILLLVTLTVTNFIYVGSGLISYAIDSITTNHENVEFEAQLKEENILTLSISVKKEGYFNGEITLENSNFNFIPNQENAYINKIEGNKLILNQLNAGATAQIDLQIKPIDDEIFDIGLLSAVSKLKLTGIYRDRTQKDIEIEAIRDVKYEYAENNTEENIENTVNVITNKIMTVSGEEKRVIQLEANLGLKNNNYPIKEIAFNVNIPAENEKEPIIVKKIDFNTMTDMNYSYENSKVLINLTNEINKEDKIVWRKQGNEKVVLTFIYDKDVDLNNVEYALEEKITLYNLKELNSSSKIVLDGEEREEVIKITASNNENLIYKGKLYSGIDRKYETKTNIEVNLANVGQYINIKEQPTTYVTEDNEISANTIYNKTVIAKETFDKIFGEKGLITILNEKGQTIATIDKSNEADENNNIVVDYTEKEPSTIEIKTTTPVAEGNVEFIHTKTIKSQDRKIVVQAKELSTKINYEYNEEEAKETTVKTKLEESNTEARLEVNKDTLSTIIENTVEMRAILKGNSEKYNLYENPSITFELPEEVEKIEINSLDLIYETELKVKNYDIDGRKLTVNLEGKQTDYKNLSIEGAILVVNANVIVNKKAASNDSQITMTYQNHETKGTVAKEIRIVAPKDVTVINSIKELNIETIGQEEIKKAILQRGEDKKQLEAQIEVINNNENAIENVKILGTFPTKNKENNIDIKIVEGISVEGAKVYYTENENATEDLRNVENSWKEEITDESKVKKYLIELPRMEKQESVTATYKMEIPELLEYNQLAKTGYRVQYTNPLVRATSEATATTIQLETGIGPKLEAKLTPIVGETELSDNIVKNGEVIKYKIEVSNIGSEEITNVTVKGNVPEGTTLVRPQDNYEYTGSSYYKELEEKVFETNIDKINVGEVATVEYEVRVNIEVAEGTKISNSAQIKYGDVIKESNTTELATTKGDLRVSVKRITDRSVDLYEFGSVEYFAIIENISNNKQDNVTVKTNLPNNLQVEKLNLITGMKSEEVSDEDLYRPGDERIAVTEVETRVIEESELTVSDEDIQITSKEIEYKDEVNIGSLEVGETKVLSYSTYIDSLENVNKINFSVIGVNGNKQHRSNIITDGVKKIDISLDMKVNTQSQYVKAGDIIEYIITAKNNATESVEGLNIIDTIPNCLTVNKVTVDGEEKERLKDKNYIEVSCDIPAKSESIIKIETIVDYSAARDEAEPITNVAYAEMLGDKVATTSEINHIIEANTTDDSGNSKPGNSDNEIKDNDIADGNKTITGIAWFDENANGQKDNNENTLSNIKVYLLNTETNNLVKDKEGKTLVATTNNNGVYVLNNIGNGKYVVIFEYNKTQYTLTKYKAEKVEEITNSDVMTNELVVNGEKQLVASTDIIEIKNDNVSGINIGLIELKDFSLKLDKFVNRILIQNSAGTVVKEYNDATVAKAELDKKIINGTTVIIEYKIKVTNIGEIDGYVKKIVDYMPNDLKFSSELNKDWYQSENNLYNASLANEKIPAGESREVKLTLTKAMTENNTGLINNTAEIAESYNELGIADSKSTPGNKTKGENDYGSADTILSIRTGGQVYITIAIIVVLALGVTAFIIVRKKLIKGDKK